MLSKGIASVREQMLSASCAVLPNPARISSCKAQGEWVSRPLCTRPPVPPIGLCYTEKEALSANEVRRCVKDVVFSPLNYIPMYVKFKLIKTLMDYNHDENYF